MKIVVFVFGVWILPALCDVVNYKPEVPLSSRIQALRTATTVTLSKPLCVFSSGTIVDVFGVQATVNSIPNEIGNSTIMTYQQTAGGATGPYRAASFDKPACTSSPFVVSTDPVTIQAEINQYLFRIGNDAQCLSQINNPPESCNAPLAAGVKYRFKYAVRNASTNGFINETLWSDSITLKQASEPTAIVPTNRRTGGMVVITIILVILLFLLLCAFAALLAIICCLQKEVSAVNPQPAPARYVTHRKKPDFTVHTNTGVTEAVTKPSPGQHYQSILPVQGSA
ncbi:uroplakin-3a-like [Scyliorhinus canicula]|uniref:uroplakin-3a-like n=1 Tax=Scyliorhinus canicula TaxID=7830 RepID=UPI0018F5874F|nr:uroplakin-3a-like [Scyliorhinus canicula]